MNSEQAMGKTASYFYSINDYETYHLPAKYTNGTILLTVRLVYL